MDTGHNGKTTPKPIGFVEGPASGLDGSGATAHSTHTFNGGPAVDIGNLPTYSSIFSSEESVVQKAASFYQVSRVRVQHQFASVKPWGEFFDRSSFGSPQHTSDVVNRLSRNISYFYSNYIILSLICSSYVLLINLPFSICVAILIFVYLLVRSKADAMANDETSDGKIHIGNFGATPMQMYLMLLVCGVIVFYLASGSSVVFWLVITSVGVTCAHASMRRPPLEQPSAFQLA